MKIIFGYYDDQDFGLTEYPDIPYPDEKDFDTFEEYAEAGEKIGEYTKFLITGIMEDFQYPESCDEILNEIKNFPQVTRKDLAKRLNRTEDSIRYYLRRMVNEGVIKHEGSTKAGKWVIIK